MKHKITLLAALVLLLSCEKIDVTTGAETISFTGDGYIVSTLVEGFSIYSDNSEWTVTDIPVYFKGFQMLVNESTGEHPCRITPYAYGMVYVIGGTDSNMPDGWQKLSGNDIIITSGTDQSTVTLNIYYKIAYGGNVVDIPTETGSLYPLIPIARSIKQ